MEIIENLDVLNTFEEVLEDEFDFTETGSRTPRNYGVRIPPKYIGCKLKGKGTCISDYRIYMGKVGKRNKRQNAIGRSCDDIENWIDEVELPKAKKIAHELVYRLEEIEFAKTVSRVENMPDK